MALLSPIYEQLPINLKTALN